MRRLWRTKSWFYFEIDIWNIYFFKRNQFIFIRLSATIKIHAYLSVRYKEQLLLWERKSGNTLALLFVLCISLKIYGHWHVDRCDFCPYIQEFNRLKCQVIAKIQLSAREYRLIGLYNYFKSLLFRKLEKVCVFTSYPVHSVYFIYIFLTSYL